MPLNLEKCKTIQELHKIADSDDYGIVRVGATIDPERRRDEYERDGYGGTMYYAQTDNMFYAENRLLELKEYRHNIQEESNAQPEKGYVYVIKGRQYSK